MRPVALSLALSLAATAASAQPRAPSVVTLEGAPDGGRTEVILRAPDDPSSQPVTLGAVSHADGSARRAAVLEGPSWQRPVVLLAVAERPSRRGETYTSALYRVDGTGAPTRLCGGLTDASRPLVTARGAVVVQRGVDGVEPIPTGRRFVERTDALRLDVVDVRTGQLRAAWSGEGQVAFLAAALRGDEVLVYQVTSRGAPLFALDVATGATRTLLADTPMSRDFSYDAARDEVVFARPTARGSATWDVLSIPAHGPSPATPRLRWRTADDHPMPRALRDGAVAVSLPGDHGLGLLAPGVTVPTTVAPLGDGSDAALAESADGQWLALRHTTAQREVFALRHRATGRVVEVPPVRAAWVDVVGFAPTRGAP